MISELYGICLDSAHRKHHEVLHRVCQYAEEKLLRK
jgi:hypothetical protein